MKRTLIVEPVLFCYMFCNLPIKTVLQQLVFRKTCLKKWNSSYCDTLDSSQNPALKYDQDTVQSDTALWLVYLNLAGFIPSLIPIVLLGSWSDHLGRKPIMRLPLIGDMITCIGFVFCAYYITSPVIILLPLMAFGAFFGGFAAILSSITAYASDVTTRESRTRRITLLETMIYLGNCLGELVGGVILQYLGFVASFVFVSGVLLIGLIYTFFLQESLYVEKHPTVKQLFNLELFFDSARVFFRKRPQRCRCTLLMLLAAFSGILLSINCVIAVLVLFAKHPPRNFTPAEIGYYTAGVNALKAFGSLVLIWVLTHRLKWSDYSVMIVGCVSYVGLGICMAVGKSRAAFWLATMWAVGIGLVTPPARSSMSKMVSTQEKGKMFAFVAVVEVLLVMAGVVMFSKVYQATVSFSVSFCFYLMAVLTLIPLTLALILKKYGQQTPYDLCVHVDSENEATAELTELNSGKSPD